MIDHETDIINMAVMFRTGSKEQKHNIISRITSMDSKGLDDFEEVSKQVMYDNKEDKDLHNTIWAMLDYVYAEKSNRIVSNIFVRFGNFLKRLIK
jgi:hypothetical protein